MRVVVTSGPTREPIDAVRFLSNVSSGRTGSAIATALVEFGHDVLLLRGPGSERPAEHPRLRCREFGSAASLLAMLLEAFDGGGGLLVHAAAVADYAPEPTTGKMSSTRGAFDLPLRPTPKVADAVRARHPGLPMVLFKLEAGIPRDELHRRARATMARVGATAIVANLLDDVGPAAHRADWLTPDGGARPLATREAIARAIVAEADRLAAERVA